MLYGTCAMCLNLHLFRQGRRHGFESGGGGNFASGASKKVFWTPHFLASGGDKILLR